MTLMKKKSEKIRNLLYFVISLSLYIILYASKDDFKAILSKMPQIRVLTIFPIQYSSKLIKYFEKSEKLL